MILEVLGTVAFCVMCLGCIYLVATTLYDDMYTRGWFR